MHKNLKNIKELVNFKKSIFIFDRGMLEWNYTQE